MHDFDQKGCPKVVIGPLLVPFLESIHSKQTRGFDQKWVHFWITYFTKTIGHAIEIFSKSDLKSGKSSLFGPPWKSFRWRKCMISIKKCVQKWIFDHFWVTFWTRFWIPLVPNCRHLWARGGPIWDPPKTGFLALFIKIPPANFSTFPRN